MTTTDVDNWPADVDGVHGPRPDAALPASTPSASTPRSSSTTSTRSTFSKRPFTLQRRLRHLHLRRADHRHRRLGQVPRPAVRAGVHGPRRQRLRHLRRLLLPRPGGVRGRRRQHRGRGGAVPVEHRQQGARGPPARQVPRRGDPGRQADGQGRRRQDASCTCGRRSTRCWATPRGVTGVRLQSTQGRRHLGARRSPAASSPSATSRTPTSSRASSR